MGAVDKFIIFDDVNFILRRGLNHNLFLSSEEAIQFGLNIGCRL